MRPRLVLLLVCLAVLGCGRKPPYQGKSVAEARAGRLAEGAFTASALAEMARARGVEMPIADCVAALVEGAIDVPGAVGALLGRPRKGED